MPTKRKAPVPPLSRSERAAARAAEKEKAEKAKEKAEKAKEKAEKAKALAAEKEKAEKAKALAAEKAAKKAAKREEHEAKKAAMAEALATRWAEYATWLVADNKKEECAKQRAKDWDLLAGNSDSDFEED